jgi:hypothetical protein
VAQFVAAEMDDLRLEVDRIAWTYTGPGELPDDTPDDVLAMACLVRMENRLPPDCFFGHTDEGEEAAVAAALRGDLSLLVEMFAPYPGRPEDTVNSAIKHVSPATWTIVCQFLTGKRNLKTGHMRGEPGRAKMSGDQRRAVNPVHRAADEVPVVAAVLKEAYPDKPKPVIAKRAAEVAAGRNGARVETLVKHLSRSQRDPRRVREE